MIEKAIEMIRQNICSVAVVTACGQVLMDSGSSVRPLMRLYETNRGQMQGAAVADRIIGRAAACILCEAGVGEVFALVMSQSARELFETYNIPAQCETTTPIITNIRGDDLCPMEKTVQGIDDLKLCIERIRAFIDKRDEPHGNG